VCLYINHHTKWRNQGRNTSMVPITTAIPRICGETWRFWVSSLAVSMRRVRTARPLDLPREDFRGGFWEGSLFLSSSLSRSFVKHRRVYASFVRTFNAMLFLTLNYNFDLFFSLSLSCVLKQQIASSGPNFPWWTKLPSPISLSLMLFWSFNSRRRRFWSA
jgi:hypothetical protein